MDITKAILTFVLQSEDYLESEVNRILHNAYRGYIDKFYGGCVTSVGLSSRGDTRYDITYIAFLNHGQNVKEGIYPVILYFRKIKKLVFTYGVSATNASSTTWDWALIGTKAPITLKELFEREGWDIYDKYFDSFVYSYYDLTDFVDKYRTVDITAMSKVVWAGSVGFKNDIDTLIGHFDRMFGASGTPSGTPAGTPIGSAPVVAPAIPLIDNRFSIKKMIEYIAETGLQYDPNLIKRFAFSLMTKPFVILSGLAGSGKTQLALVFAKALAEVHYKDNGHDGDCVGDDKGAETDKSIDNDNVIYNDNLRDTEKCIEDAKDTDKESDKEDGKGADKEKVQDQICTVAVGADWTNREPLLGYPNALDSGKYVSPESGVLDLLIRASKPENQHKPYFLILDEMNMSYVERYFADFLSGMESHEAIKLWNTGVEGGVPNEIKIPKNLYIIGTINVDETTYMFSPKVLDRASVIEFKISPDEMTMFLGKISDVDTDQICGKASNMAEDFIERSREAKEKMKDASTLTTINGKIKDTLVDFFKELKAVNAEFGYRSANEIYKYMIVADGNDDTDVVMTFEEMLDSAIVQKLLPKLHGSRKKLTPALKALWKLCCPGSDLETNVTGVPVDAKYPLSADKIFRMYRCAIDNGFASFSEA